VTRKLSLAGLLAALLALVLAPAVSAQGGTAKVRVIHASPDAPAVDVYVNGQAALTNVPFFTASDYLDLPAGTHQIQVTPTGQPASSAVIDTSATVAAGRAYSIAATGLVANITATVFEDNLSAPASGQAKVRVYHLSPDAPAVDVKVAGGDTLISSLAFPNASDYLAVPAGSYDLQVTPAGGSDVVINLAGTSLQAGQVYSVFATNVLAEITPELAATQPAAASAAAPAAPAAGQPSTLPATSTGDDAGLAPIAVAAIALILAGAFVLRRRAA